MNILFMGNLSKVSKAFFDKMTEDYRCVVYCEKENTSLQCKEIINYFKESSDEKELRRIFSTFDFETVCFFSGTLDGAEKVYDELETLESAIQASRQYKVKHFIYITTNDIFMEGEQPLENKSRVMLMHSCEKLCKTFATEQRIKFLVLRIPYLYNLENNGSQLMQWIYSGNKGDKVVIRGSKLQETDFLCDEDLGELIGRILDEPVKEDYDEMFLSGGNTITFGEISELLKSRIKDATIVFENSQDCIPCSKKDKKARTEYGWFPKHILEDDLDRMVAWDLDRKKRKDKKKERRRRYQKLSDRIRVICELIILFILAEVLNYYTRNNVLLNFIDFRLVFVAITGTMNGLNAGVIAAILSCIGYVLSNSSEVSWQVIFYNVENWLPFACYFLLGAISGYTRDKHDDEVIYAREEHDILENKYVFLNELYNQVLESKDNFNSQIIGYKDSFGKVYSVIKKLDTILPDKVFYEAVDVLEELLENTSVAIYTLNKSSDFARLNVCSKLINNSLSKSMKIIDYPVMLECLKDKRGFVNTECLKDYPAYAAPIQKNGELVGMILLMNSTERQKNMEFSNKFFIISDLISDALIRAMEFEQVSNHYIEGTQVLQAEKFMEILTVKEQMKKKEYLDYVLLRLQKNDMELKELSERVCGMVRNSDVIGLGEDNEVYLLLSQTRQNDLAIIAERMKKNGVMFEVVKK